MIRAGLVSLVLVGPAAAEGVVGEVLCKAVWDRIAGGLQGVVEVIVDDVVQDGDWCVAVSPVLDNPGQYAPDVHVDRLKVRGAALGWIADGSGLPEGLEIAVEGLRLVVQTGDAQMDWLFAAQARPNGIDGEASLSWDKGAKVLRLEALSLDFPGENLVEASATVERVDLSSPGAVQMSLTGFALTEADLKVTTHGLFEWYALMALGPMLLPPEGNMEAGAEEVRRDLRGVVAELPDQMFAPESKAALVALIGELPNPSGDLTVRLRAEPGIGPSRVAGYAVTGVPATMTEAAPLFQGVVVDVGWTHADAP